MLILKLTRGMYMGYVPTTNYGFQKPEKSNSFNVDDLNNALDKADEVIKNVDDAVKANEESFGSRITEVENNIPTKVNIKEGTTEGGIKVVITKKNNQIIESPEYKLPALGVQVFIQRAYPENIKPGDIWIVEGDL